MSDPTAAPGVGLRWHGGHTRGHLYRSLLEGVAFELRLQLEGIEAATEVPVTLLRAMVGASCSPSRAGSTAAGGDLRPTA